MAPYPDPQTAPIMFRPVPHDPMSPYTSVPMAGWTSSPTQRGTIQIIWSCLAVLFICSYKCIHLNIPSRNETASAWLRYRNVPYWPDTHRWRMLLRKVKWMALVLIVPDLGVGMAAFDRMKAEGALKEANKKLPDDWKETPFTLTHAHYAAMGGFIGQDGMPVTLQEYTDFIVNDTLKFSMTVGETASSSLYYRSEAELQALSKSDTITKWLAIGQSLFLVLQCIARRAAGLHYSLLELVTISYVLCSAAMYALWWEKPYDAHNVTILPIRNRGEVRYAVAGRMSTMYPYRGGHLIPGRTVTPARPRDASATLGVLEGSLPVSTRSQGSQANTTTAIGQVFSTSGSSATSTSTTTATAFFPVLSKPTKPTAYDCAWDKVLCIKAKGY
ncbi:hypothetical protein GGTG_04391 [Gaeumannomyces tritici R3-111a-1]|uniref:Uncharacterized protein n=1 Tax=Gaeumannomyces tritici (strain R3-111a-1) TaxID=644352 RepID=J3NSZ3_GAET3|nr:hypothetical protein GGTG_04391 [Gaeumannomyces tritici R3-111a-1]EJT79306.1 hypothetical protein GGTG_04391 [Gaeumannomyces tritici R3-111a-1]